MGNIPSITLIIAAQVGSKGGGVCGEAPPMGTLTGVEKPSMSGSVRRTFQSGSAALAGPEPEPAESVADC